MAADVSRSKLFVARLVVAMVVVFLVVGLVMNGFSAEVRERIWHNLLERPGGPMTFRFYLQPVMATIAAFVDGARDARTGRRPFMEAIVADPASRKGRLEEAVIATARIILLGLVMDAIYQFVVFRTFHPAEAVIIALVLAFVPYIVMRGLITRAARRWYGRASPGAGR